MRARGLRIEQLLLGLVLLAALVWNLAEAREVRSVTLRETASGTRAEIALDSRVDYRTISLSNPDRLVLDIAQAGMSPRVALPAGGGVVKSVRSGQPESGTTRIVFDLAAPVVAIGPHLEWREGQAVLILEWPGDGIAAIAAAASATPVPSATAAASSPPQTAATPSPPPPATVATPSPSATVAPPSPATAATPSSSPAQAAMPASPDRLPQVASNPAPRQAVPPAPAASSPPASATPVRTLQEMNRPGMLRSIVVAIDAGHGGQDPGAVGMNGTREKDITLAVARELARQVDAMPGLKSYLTRDADFFIPLAERYQRARRAKADVFVSIHADAAENRAARGSSVYVLSLRGATSQAARWLADRENAADLVGGVKLKGKENTLASVLLDLSQSATQRASERIAGEVLGGLRRLGKTHKNQIEKANFVVLRSPDVPSMLVETAFISNPDEEARLKNPAFQRQLARAVLDGIHTHFTRMPPPGTHYAARREAPQAGSVSNAAASP
ncbi:AMIN domain-containing protein [Lysobacter pythonis]|uniref:N-acetylmuramoyl-L-alanine amidase AmiC n=1 Tax=Solilutibacter pythonis TaxID=2483112 RepID=A0A3M2I470_9GAMM|nr:N-acetylmuramoyl-L-alanine amidase [Lysobacter pythonis]RMH93004.1 AMIN domain-containing protein [Lysobacter pythonis]